MEENPFLRYGTGIQAYFSIQFNMIKLFCLMTIYVIPQMVVYGYFGGFNWTTDANLFEKLSFGNMGFSGNYCGMRFISWDHPTTSISLQCQGTTRIRAVIDSGIVDVNQSGEDEKLTEFNRCYYPKPVDTQAYPIMSGFQELDVEAVVMNKCNGL